MDEKSKKLIKKHNMSIGEDRISDLPNVILDNILSFLDMKYVVATCILSTRWKDVWKSVPHLDFSDNPRCINSIDKVLLSRDLTSNIERFSFISNQRWESSRVRSWISTVARYKLRELVLTFVGDQLILPPSLFCLESLTVLRITSCGAVKLTSPICFPRLKIFDLQFFEFCDGYITENFSNCPLLEELVITNCWWDNTLKNISISNPLLKRLILRSWEDQDHNFDIININAPSLVYLSWESEYLPIECNLSAMPSLASAFVTFQQFYVDRPMNKIGCAACMLLRALCHVKSLTISAQGYKPYRIKEELNWESDTVPQTWLSHLKKVEYCEFDGHPLEIALIKYLLENATALEEIIIQVWKGGNDIIEFLEKFLEMPRSSDKCAIRLRWSDVRGIID
ncbi:hypothetical protein ACHQM5_011416 [Ranunculus cassubicifolius]